MRSKQLKYTITVSLLVIFINRALFVAMPGIETYSSNCDINTLLEMILYWAGSENDIDEDGDFPENYNVVNSAQPLIDNKSTFILMVFIFASFHKLFHIFNDSITSFPAYGTIDHPPEIKV